MDHWQEALFAPFPRSVGTPSQHMVSTQAGFEVFLDTIEGRLNGYASLSWYPVETDFRPVTDKVAFDLDSPRKEAAFEAGLSDGEKIERMRQDPDLADRVLGEVCEDVQSLAQVSREEGVDVVGVYSGFGVHFYQLYAPTSAPEGKLASTARRFADKADVRTLDDAPVGDAERILRVPNVRRVDDPWPTDPSRDGEPCDLVCVPLTGDELAELTPRDLLAWSREPRCPPLPDVSRPEMEHWPSYADQNPRTQLDADQKELAEGVDPSLLTEDGLEWLLSELLQLPCMYERLLQPNPAHEVRRNSAVVLFNAGLTPREVEDLYARLGWADWNREVTRKHLEQLYESGYSDMTCRSIRSLGLCTRDDDPSDCRTYGWAGGRPEWKTRSVTSPPSGGDTGTEVINRG